ncbi:hypothetical protein [Chryseobacterium taichungense]|uniref:Outer membrane protein beta-barrel domain-containing protein n=1 Tax=Chryseobacterium taichungense TaxID=295069 RepID=A0A1H8DMG7_9FLAO|nr:hypothetical protein [Chryseobacterium taichungense]SEN08366.1 hypothetical protein SAMN05421856_11446 [Chryseobacterium taichungense]
MKLQILLCTTLVLAIRITAQEQPKNEQQQDHLQSSPSYGQKQERDHSIITISGLAPLRDQRWNIGYLHKLNKRWWIGAEVAYGQKGMTPYNLGFEGDFKVFEVKPELYYSLNPKSRLKHFISAEFSYLNHSSQRVNDGYYDTTGQYYNYTSADFKRIRKGLSINYSILLGRRSSWFGFMPKVGLGIAHRNISYQHVEGKTLSYEPIDVLPFLPDMDREQSGLRFLVNADVKFIFKF